MDGGGENEVHPAIEPLSYLLGTWKGQGEGGFPTISSFTYGEQLHFSHSGYKPVIAYSQRTWKLDSGEPMHSESGYLRPKPDGTIEFVIAQSTGLVEVQKGTYDRERRVVKLRSELVGNASKLGRVFCVMIVPRWKTRSEIWANFSLNRTNCYSDWLTLQFGISTGPVQPCFRLVQHSFR